MAMNERWTDPSLFLNDDFYLSTPLARRLYHEIAAPLPILDYHCHLPPRDIAENRSFDNLAEAWLEGDHYKWRLMRANGVAEDLVRGPADPRERFRAFARTLPMAPGNPVFLWAHLELLRYFGIREPLCETSADRIWAAARERLSGWGCRDIIRQSGVEALCTTDDPADDLSWHRRIRESQEDGSAGAFRTRVRPAFRPDRAMNLEADGYGDWLDRLASAAGMEGGIGDCAGLQLALSRRMDAFGAEGCCLSDHALAWVPGLAEGEAFPDDAELDGLFQRRLSGVRPAAAECDRFRLGLLVWLGREVAARGWTFQLHIGALRNNHSRAFRVAGPDSGYDAIADRPLARPLAALLDRLALEEALPRTILYSLNPGDTIVLASLAGCFQDSVPGKVQVGSAWWFNDTREGMWQQLTVTAEQGLLGRFVGMLTDSRSFFSYPRHEVFRRLLCERLGAYAASGELPADPECLRPVVEGVCVRNARELLGI